MAAKPMSQGKDYEGPLPGRWVDVLAAMDAVAVEGGDGRPALGTLGLQPASGQAQDGPYPNGQG